MAAVRRLVLARHGESRTNADNIFTGWSDPPLTARGEDEARRIATQLATAGVQPDRVFTSALRRAADTARIVLAETGRSDIAPIASPALNERDYGALTGLNKAEAAERFGAETVGRWRRSWDQGPPQGESLRDTASRVLPFYLRRILPEVMRARTVLVIAHGNSLRALCMALEGLRPAEVERLEIGTGSCRLYSLGADTSICRATLLGDDVPIPLRPVDEE